AHHPEPTFGVGTKRQISCPLAAMWSDAGLYDRLCRMRKASSRGWQHGLPVAGLTGAMAYPGDAAPAHPADRAHLAKRTVRRPRVAIRCQIRWVSGPRLSRAEPPRLAPRWPRT